MRIFITGICGFVGSTLARSLQNALPNTQIFGIDNYSRSGSWINRENLLKSGIKIYTGDIRNASDLESLPAADWLIDAAAIPSVIAGIDGKINSRQLVENNLQGTVNLLEYCKKNRSGFVLLSTSRVYSIGGIAKLKMLSGNNKSFQPDPSQKFPIGISINGVSEGYSTLPPVSLYGSTKVASENLALEYGYTFNFPVWINRCGVLSGPSQFGHPAQGIFSFWIHSFRENKPLKYIGFGGNGFQVRDCLDPKDLVDLLLLQFNEPLHSSKPRIVNVSGGSKNSMSLRQLSEWCEIRFGKKIIDMEKENRPFDIPWMVLDHSECSRVWGWTPKIHIDSILEEIAGFAMNRPNWLDVSNS